MIRIFFKVFLIVVGVMAILFGLIGGIMELSSDKADTTGLILAPVFIALGSVLLYLGIHKKKPAGPKTISPQTDLPPKTTLLKTSVPPTTTLPLNPETTEEKGDFSNNSGQTSDVSTWQRKFLIVSGSIEFTLMTLAIILASIIGVAGFVGGEMGTMIGIIMFAGIIGVGAAVSMRIVALWGLVKKKRWASIVNLILVIGLTAFAISITMWPIIPYFGFTGWCSIYLIRHPSS